MFNWINNLFKSKKSKMISSNKSANEIFFKDKNLDVESVSVDSNLFLRNLIDLNKKGIITNETFRQLRQQFEGINEEDIYQVLKKDFNERYKEEGGGRSSSAISS